MLFFITCKTILQRRIFWCFFCCIAYTVSRAQQPHNDWYLSKILNDNNGLPQNSIRSMYYDTATNFLWLATEAGLVRYDGQNTRVFDNRDMPWLHSMRIHNLFATALGKVIGINILGETFSIQQTHPVPGATIEANLSRTVMYRSGNVQSIAGVAVEQATLRNENITNNQQTTILWLNDTAWMVSAVNYTGLMHRGRMVRRWPHPQDSLTQVLIARSNWVYVINPWGGGYCINKATGTKTLIRVQSRLLAPGQSTLFYKTLYGKPMLLRGNELHEIIFNNEVLSTRLVAVLPVMPTYINTLAMDKTGRYLFVATNTNGLYIYHLSPFRVYTVADDDIYNAQYACVPADSQHIFSSRSVLFNMQTGAAVKLPLTLRNLNALVADSSGRLWAEKEQGTAQGAARFRISGEGRIVQDLFLADTLVGAYRAANNRIWLSTWRHLGYITADTLQPVVSYTSPSNWLRFMAETPDGQLVGITDSRIVRVDIARKKLVPILQNRLLLQARFIQVDSGGLCWITTYGNGIFVGRLATGQLTQLPVDDKGYLLYSHALVEDGKGHFLVPTNKGLFRLSKSNLLQIEKAPATPLCYQYFDVADGLLTNEFNGGCQPAYNRLPGGDILLPALRGLVRVKIKELALPPPAAIWVDDVETRAGRSRPSANTKFGSSERTQTWRLNISHWTHYNNQGIFYRLNGDGAWQRLPARETSIVLSELKGGSHTLYIRYQYGLQPQELTEAVYRFSIERYYYETASFWLFIVLLLAGMLYGVARLRNRQLKRKNLQLQNVIRLNTHDLSNKNEQLEETLADLREALRSLRENSIFKDRLIGVLGHDMMVPLRFITHIADHLYESDMVASPVAAKESSKKIKYTATELLYLGEGLIQWIKLQEGRFRLIIRPFGLQLLAEEIFQVHKTLAAQKNNSLVNTIPANANCSYDPIFLKVIIHNLLLNANKYTVAGLVEVHAGLTENELMFRVTDTGCGMDAALVQSLNNGVAVPSQLGTNKEAGWGMGYLLIIDLLRFAGGKLLVESVLGEGTAIHFTLPLKPEAFMDGG